MATEVTPLVRIVSGKGSITIPEDFANASDIVLYVDVIREADTVYRNFNSNPSESFFGRFCACVGDSVLYSRQISFDREMFQLFPGDVSDVMQAIKCLERSILLGIRALADIAGGEILPPDPYPLDVYEPQGYVPDNFKFVCYGGTALKLTLTAYENENCGDNEFPRKKPPTPPLPPSKVPPGTPVEVSPPEPDFPDATDPFPGDTEEPANDLPFGTACIPVTVIYNVTIPDVPAYPGLFDVVLNTLGVVESIYINFDAGVWTAGFITGQLVGSECIQGVETSVFSTSDGEPLIEIVEIFDTIE